MPVGTSAPGFGVQPKKKVADKVVVRKDETQMLEKEESLLEKKLRYNA